MKPVAIAHGIVVGLMLVACGGSVAPASEQPGTTTKPDGGFAPAGQMVIEVNGQTFTAPITECSVDENNFFVQAKDQASNLALEARVFDAGAGWVVGASVTQNDISYIAASSTGPDPVISGRTLTATADFGQSTAELPVDVGQGTISATCPE